MTCRGNVRLGIANQRIVVRTLDLPPLEDDPKALAAAVRGAGARPHPDADGRGGARLAVARQVDTPAGPRNRVVVVAVRREVVDRLVAAAERGRAHASRASTFPRSAWSARCGVRHASGATLYISVAGLTNVAVANERGCLFTRAAAGGLDAIVQDARPSAGG